MYIYVELGNRFVGYPRHYISKLESTQMDLSVDGCLRSVFLIIVRNKKSKFIHSREHLMKLKSISLPSETGGYAKFLIFGYVISALLMFSSSIVVWAEAPETEKIAFVSKRDGNVNIL